MHKQKTRIIVLLAVIAVLSVAYLSDAGVSGSKHDLSTPGYSPRIFCHTPHAANTDPDFAGAPLWNKTIAVKNFTPYTGMDMQSTPPGTPSGISLACLSCHDAVIGNGSDNGGQVDAHDSINQMGTNDLITVASDCTKCHTGNFADGEFGVALGYKVGKDLTNDHPISMTYPIGLDPDLANPPDPLKGWPDVLLFGGKVECASCHDPHSTVNTYFLRKDNTNSNLCRTCHTK